LKQVKSSFYTASRNAVRKALTRAVWRSAAWTLFFLPPIQRLHRPPERGLAHGRAADGGQPDAAFGQRGVGFLAQAGRQLRLDRRIPQWRWAAMLRQSGHGTARALAPAQLANKRIRHAELRGQFANRTAALLASGRHTFTQVDGIGFHQPKVR
jgi:hypothetical protein